MYKTFVISLQNIHNLSHKYPKEFEQKSKEFDSVQDLQNLVKSLNDLLEEKGEIITKQESELETKNLKIDQLEFELSRHKRLVFGRKSEKLKNLTSKERSLSFFDDLDLLSEDKEAQAEKSLQEEAAKLFAEKEALEKKLKEVDRKISPDKKKGRKLFAESNPNMEFAEEEIDLEEADKICAECNGSLTKIGSESSESLEYIPAKIIVKKIIRNKYCCKECESSVKLAKNIKKPFAGSPVTSSLLSNIFISKFEDHLPFYRQSKIFKRYDFNISRKLLNNWLFNSSKLLLALSFALREEILSSNYLGADETPVTLLDKKKGNKGYMWVYRSFEQGKQLVYYDFSLDRKKENPISFLNNYKGYLQCDAYAGYDFVNDDKDIVRLGCLAHCRRKFEEIIKSYKVKIRSSNNIANGFLNRIAKLYLLEKKVKLEKMNFVEIKKFRNDEAKVILEDLLKFAQEKIIKLANHSPLYKAINYFLNQYQFIINYLEEGYLDIDNNKTENAIRPFAVPFKTF